MEAQSNPAKTVIITGGARGIGAATARLLADGGTNVLITDVLDPEGTALADEIQGNARYCRLDVTREEDWQDAVATCERLFGPIDGLFNNAGVLLRGSIDDCTIDDFKRVLDINLFGIFLGIRAVAPAMRRAGGGMIVNTSSIAGLQGYAGLAGYTASKWGIRGLTKAAALDLADDGIRVVSLHPGPIHTPMTADMPEDVAAHQPMPRFGEAIEVARMVRFLFAEASYSTGCEFIVDGGAVAGERLPLEPELPGLTVAHGTNQ